MSGYFFASTLPAESNARYAGKGVKFNDATTAVFWYKPAAASNYRVIFGDLSVREQKAEPQSPNAVPVKLGNPALDLIRKTQDNVMKGLPPFGPPAAPVEPALPPKKLPRVAPLALGDQTRLDIPQIRSAQLKDESSCMRIWTLKS